MLLTFLPHAVSRRLAFVSTRQTPRLAASTTALASASSSSPHHQRPSHLDRESMSYSLDDLDSSDRPLPPTTLQDDTYGGGIPEDYHSMMQDESFWMTDNYQEHDPTVLKGKPREITSERTTEAAKSAITNDLIAAPMETTKMDKQRQMKAKMAPPAASQTISTPPTTTRSIQSASTTSFHLSNQTTLASAHARAFSTTIQESPPPSPPPANTMTPSSNRHFPINADVSTPVSAPMNDWWDDDTPPVPPPEPSEPGAFSRALEFLKPRDDMEEDDAEAASSVASPSTTTPSALSPPKARANTGSPPIAKRTETISPPQASLESQPTVENAETSDSSKEHANTVDIEDEMQMLYQLEDESLNMEISGDRHPSNLQFAPKSTRKPTALPTRAALVTTSGVSMKDLQFDDKNANDIHHRRSFEIDDEEEDDNGGDIAFRSPPPAVLEDDTVKPAMHASFMERKPVTPLQQRRAQIVSQRKQAPQTILSQTDPVVETKKESKAPPKVYEKETDELKAEMERLETEIYAENNGVAFKLTSIKQVANALHGEPEPGADRSTNKAKLEAMASTGGKRARMAGLILDYRTVKREVDKRKKQSQLKSQGRVVQSALETKSTSSGDNSPDIFQRAREQDPLLLVDASHLIFQSYHALPPIHRNDGTPVGAVLGFCMKLNSLIVFPFHERNKTNEEKLYPRVVLCFDSKEKKSFRHDIFPEYKAQRPDVAQDLIPQFALVREASDAYGLCQIEAPGYEADDVIATLATWASEQGIHTNIISRDKDLMQLIRDASDDKGAIYMVDTDSKELIGPEQVHAKHGVYPSALGDMLALMGDKSDNIPGVPGIGPITAAKLLSEHQSLDAILRNPEAVKSAKARKSLVANTENARLSRELVELVRDVPVENFRFKVGDSLNTTITTNEPMQVENLDGFIDLIRMEEVNQDRILKLYDSLGLFRIREIFLKAMKGAKGPTSNPRKRKTQVPKPEDFADIPF